MAANFALSDVAQAIVSKLLETGEATRRSLAQTTGLSFPTVTGGLGELTAKGLVCERRREQGARGRATIVYGISGDAGWVLGVDIGSTQVSFMARSLDGQVLVQDSRAHDGAGSRPGPLAGRLVADSRPLKRLNTPPLAVGLALNQVVPRQLVSADRPGPPAIEAARSFVATSGLSPDIPVVLENNVNCAAVAEHQDGLMKGYDDAAYMQIGVGIGLGFFADGALIRGGHGASGELAQIPVSWSHAVPSGLDAIERQYGSRGLSQAAARVFPGATVPLSPEALFSLAAAGSAEASEIMRQFGVALARIAATASTILDPAIMVLGGGLARDAIFSQIIVSEFVARNQEVRIAISDKGTEATVLGACLLARDLAITRIAERYHKPLSARPTLFHRSARAPG